MSPERTRSLIELTKLPKHLFLRKARSNLSWVGVDIDGPRNDSSEPTPRYSLGLIGGSPDFFKVDAVASIRSTIPATPRLLALPQRAPSTPLSRVERVVGMG